MSNGVTVDADAIRKLAEILRDTDLTEIEVAEKDARIRVARVIPAAPPAQYFAAPAMPQMPAMAPMAAARPQPRPSIQLTRMPTSLAESGFCAAARIARPTEV